MTAFSPQAVAAGIQDRLWRYLTAHAQPIDIPGVVERLFELDPGDVRRLAAVHVALARETDAMLRAVPALLRELPSSVTRSRVETRGAIESPVDWATTFRRRRQTRDISLFSSDPPERGYDTALGRLVVLSLRQCTELKDTANLDRGPLAEALASLDTRAAHLLGHRKLRHVTPVKVLPERTLRTLTRFRHTEPVVAFTRLFREAVHELSPRITKDVISRRLLAPATPDRLFELFVGFRVVDAFCAEGFAEHHIQLTPSRHVPLSTLKRGHQQVTIWWQRPAWWALGLDARDGEYAAIQSAASMSRSTLRPDFVIVAEPGPTVLVVEVKLTEREGYTPDRVGIRDVMAYLHDLGSIVTTKPPPHALVVAWDAEGRPGPGRVVVSDQEGIPSAISEALSQWQAA